MGKSKYYVVWKGVQPGIYDNWETCKAQTLGFAEAKYKSFDSLADAQAALKNGWEAYFSISPKAPPPNTPLPVAALPAATRRPILPSISVDAACSGNPGVVEYQGVDTATKQRLFYYKLPQGTNNIGEFLAIVHALAMLQKSGQLRLPIYSDSQNAIAWVKAKQPKTTLERNTHTQLAFEMLDRAVAWLQNNTFKNPVLKWQTDTWGENPADFGRK